MGDLNVYPRKEHGSTTTERAVREDTALTAPACVAPLLESGLCSSDKLQGVAPRINGKLRLLLADPDLGSFDENENPDRVYTMRWCLQPPLGGKNVSLMEFLKR